MDLVICESQISTCLFVEGSTFATCVGGFCLSGFIVGDFPGEMNFEELLTCRVAFRVLSERNQIPVGKDRKLEFQHARLWTIDSCWFRHTFLNRRTQFFLSCRSSDVELYRRKLEIVFSVFV